MLRIPLDANDLPPGHDDALRAAAKEMAACVNELPDSVYHLSPDDAEWATRRIVTRYWHVLLEAVQRERALTLVK